jgi:hypothetical protein
VDHWDSSQIYKAWEQIYRALLEAMKPLPRPTLAFFANNAADGIIRSQAAQVLDWRENRHGLPDWGWALCRDKERHR